MSRVISLFIFVSVSFCGDSDSSEHRPQADPSLSSFVPANWDGLQDWDGSAWTLEQP